MLGFIKKLFLFLFIVLLLLAAVVMLVPPTQTIEKSVQIKAPAAKIYEELLYLKGIDKWSPYNFTDSSLHYNVTGNNATPGSSVYWEGNRQSGKGEIVLKNMVLNTFDHDVTVFEPRYFEAKSHIDIKENNGISTVTWQFSVPLKRPFNLYHLFRNLDRTYGAGFDRVLASFKQYMETMPPPPPPVIVQSIYFPYTSYVGIRQNVVWADYGMFFPTHFNHLATYTLNGQVDNPLKTALIFAQNDSARQSDVAAVLPVPSGYMPVLQSPEQMINITGSKAVSVFIKGDDEQKTIAYKKLNDYIQQNRLVLKRPVIEQYPADSATKIIYLVEDSIAYIK